jgi:hypothetical protein
VSKPAVSAEDQPRGFYLKKVERALGDLRRAGDRYESLISSTLKKTLKNQVRSDELERTIDTTRRKLIAERKRLSGNIISRLLNRDRIASLTDQIDKLRDASINAFRASLSEQKLKW